MEKQMTEKAKQLKRAYYKAWRDANKEKVRKHQATYKARHPEKAKQYDIDYWNRQADAQGL